MLPIHWKMAELWSLKKTRDLTQAEMDEMSLCLQANMNYARKLAGLYNLSGVASQTDDMDWLHGICAEIDKLEIEYKTKVQG